MGYSRLPDKVFMEKLKVTFRINSIKTQLGAVVMGIKYSL